MVSKKTFKTIIDFLKKKLNIIPTQGQFDEIVNKLELAEYIRKGIAIEWEWIVKLSGSCFSCCEDGADQWIKNTD